MSRSCRRAARLACLTSSCGLGPRSARNRSLAPCWLRRLRRRSWFFVIGAFAETSADVRLLLRETAEAAAARFWRDAGATSATAAQSVYMSVYRRRWGAEFALQGARMRIARAYLVAGQAEPAPRDPRGGGFDPGDAAAFAAASAPSLPGVPQGQSGFASRGG